MLNFPGYTVGNMLHRGRETVLHEATREADGLAVVLKSCAHPVPGPKERARLRYEFELLREIATPGIVRAISLETTNQGPTLVLEKLSGTALDRYLVEKRPGVRESLDLAIAMSRVLAAVHARQVIHKDLKPHHWFYDATTRQMCVIDFGIATRLGDIAGQRGGSSGLEGTLAYLSPEQTGRVHIPLDRRSDLYSLGVTFYELFTGALPFASVDPVELLYSHVARQPLAPHLRDSSIPTTLSAIIMKLMAKAPEERYQSARGLEADLLTCASMLDQYGRISDGMKLAERDVPYELQISRKLYHREVECAKLLNIFDQVSNGNNALVLISGYSGVGKTALVAEVRRALMHHGGFFATGKFDQLNRNTPYGSLAHALRELVQHIMVQSPEVVTQWKQKLQAALGGNESSLAMLIPELDALLGPLPAAPALGPAESQNRFDIAVDALIRAFCREGQPLVMALDDLQWADHASLRLIQMLFSQGAPQGLMVLGAYRDNEVDASHPLQVILAALRRDKVNVHEVQLLPLRQEDLQAMLADTLSLPMANVESLSRSVFDKTQGNPFFAGQFVSTLYRDELLVFSPNERRWTWNDEQIQQRSVTANVIEFMAERLRLLPERTRQTLTMAACIGYEFDLQTLAIICEKTPDDVVNELQEALRAGAIQPLQLDHRYAAYREDDALAAQATYRFVHDRIHEAAYALIAPSERAALRLRIGRLLLSRFDASSSHQHDADTIYAITNHLNQGRDLITDVAERHNLADLNRRAGERARAGTAFSTASEYFRMGLDLLEIEGETADRSLLLALLLGFAESESLCGRFANAEASFERIDKLAPTPLARAQATCLRLKLYQVAGRYLDGVRLSERVLRLLDIVLPSSADETNAAIGAEIAHIKTNMADRSIEDLLDAPLVEDPSIRVAIELLVNAAPCAYIGKPEAFPFIALKMLNLSLRHGNTPASCFAYSVYGFMLVAVFGDINAGYRFSEMSIRLNEKLNDISLRGTLLHLHGDHINFWKNHIRTDLPILEKAFIACQQAGDYVYANYLAFETIWQWFELGDPLEETLNNSNRFAVFSKKTKNEAVYQTICLEQQFFRTLMNKTERSLELGGSDFDDKKSRQIIADASFGCGIAFGHIIDLMLAYYRGDLGAARAAATATVPHLGAVMAMPIEATYYLFQSLTCAASMNDGTDAENATWGETLDANLGKLSRWAAASPATFESKYRLAQAEAHRARGHLLEALHEYDLAIDAAEQNGFIHEVALASERAGHCLLSMGRRRSAAFYLSLAMRYWLRWGAVALARRVETPVTALRAYLAPFISEANKNEVTYTTHTITSHEITARLLDVASVLKTAQAIASEMEMGRLLEQVMGIVLTNAGAQRSALILARSTNGRQDEKKSFEIVSIATASPDQVRVNLALDLATHGHEVPQTVTTFVTNTRNALIASNPHQDPKFANDEYLQKRKPRSLVCMPLMHQNQLSGLMYLENAIVQDAFSRERIDLLHMLCAQVAIAIENARLYERVRETSAQLRTTNEKLEGEVAARTAELQTRGDQLDAINQLLHQELEERQKAEQERVQLQDEIIRTQNERLAEMGTPLIPISSEIVVMPLIGTVDEKRANQVLETALRGSQQVQPEFLILDITGIHRVDHAVAETLLRTARAMRLLGTAAIITGVRPDVAQTLIQLNIDMGQIACLSRLQDGITYAQQRLRKRVTTVATPRRATPLR